MKSAAGAQPEASFAAGSRSLMLVVYGLCYVLAVAFLPLGPNHRWAEIVPALALQALVGIALARGSSSRAKGLAPLGVVAYVASVLALRDGVGANAGFGTLVLLPVAWAALGGRRRELAVAVVGVAFVYIVPILVIGGPRYPAAGWRAGILFTVIAGGLGTAVILLVERLADLARTDALTGLPNRRAWQEILERDLRIAGRTGRPVTVAMLDLDSFKHYNDTHGHLLADSFLREVAVAWHATLRRTDLLARWGGDEFGLLLPGCDAACALAAIERLRSARPDVAFSVGIAEAADHATPEAIIAAADKALYRSKAGRRRGDRLASDPERTGSTTRVAQASTPAEGEAVLSR